MYYTIMTIVCIYSVGVIILYSVYTVKNADIYGMLGYVYI